jgi:tetratricopeptide (TPR) repeat protein
MHLKTIFLSSTYKDLAKHRQAVMQAINRLHRYHVVAMEDFGARDVPPIEYVTAEVVAADVFVGLVGHLHGSCPDGDNRSFTECEYQAAIDNGKRCLMFIAAENSYVPAKLTEPDEKRQKQRAFRESVQNQRYIYDSFTSPHDLAARVVTALHNLVDHANVTSPLPPQPDLVHPYPLQKNFVGRLRERTALTHWLTSGDEPIMSVIAIGGMGKSALTWAWLIFDVLGLPLPGYVDRSTVELPRCRLAESARPQGVFWWSFYERDASVTAFLDRVLLYANHGRQEPAKIRSISDKLEALRGLLEKKRILIVLDGFERQLHSYARGSNKRKNTKTTKDDLACTDPRVGEFLRKVASCPARGRLLLTSRHLPRELEELAGVHDYRLTSLQPDDAVEFFHAQKVSGTRSDIEHACKRYAYHPLSLRILTGLIRLDRKSPGDVRVSNRYSVGPKLKPKEHHILNVAFRSLSAPNRLLLGAIASFRDAADYSAISTLNIYRSERNLDFALNELIERDLLMVRTDLNRYDLHPIVREYAYKRLVATERKAIHLKLSRYFARLIVQSSASARDFSDLIEGYHHTVSIGEYKKAYKIIHDQLFSSLHYEYGDYRSNIELLGALFPNGETQPPRLSTMPRKTMSAPILTGTHFSLRNRYEIPAVWAINALGVSYRACGFPRNAENLFRAANEISARSRTTEDSLLTGWINLSDVQWTIGRFKSSDENLRRLIERSARIRDPSLETVGHQDLGLRLAFRGFWSDSEAEFKLAMSLARKAKDSHRQSIIYSHKTRKELLLARSEKSSRLADTARKRALTAARQTIKLLPPGQVERHHVRALWLLGEAYLINGKLARAEKYLHEALIECRRIDLIEFEAAVLLGLTRFLMAQHKWEKAKELASTAMEIAQRSDFVLDETDAHLLLAELALLSRDRDLAKSHATRAQKLAVCDGLPDYAYKVAYDEARLLFTATSQKWARA